VQRRRGHEQRVARRDLDPMHLGQDRRPVLLSQPGLDLGAVDPPPAEEHVGVWARLEDDPCLGLAVRESEVLAGERARRVPMNGEPLPGVEELHEDPGIPAERRRVRRAEESLGLLGHGVAQKAAVGQPAEPSLGRSEHAGARPTQSSGAWSSATSIPRKRAIDGPPR
jgi:hypothetical protein